MITRSDLLLGLFGAGRPDAWLDPISIMKGLFLAQMESGSESEDRMPLQDAPFRFEPYSYGPYSQAVYSELESLRQDGLLKSSGVYGKDYLIWSLTEEGQTEAQAALKRLGVDGAGRVQHARSIVDDYSFDGLLRYVYSRYPDYAKRSVY